MILIGYPSFLSTEIDSCGGYYSDKMAGWLGRTNLLAYRYLGVDVDDALEMSEQTDI